MASNVTQNMFVFIGRLTSFGEIMKEFPSNDVETFTDQMFQIGEDYGTCLRTLYDFHPVDSDNNDYIFPDDIDDNNGEWEDN